MGKPVVMTGLFFAYYLMYIIYMRKTGLLLFFLLTFMSISAQQVKLQIEGTAPAEMQTIYLIDASRQVPIDSVVPHEGKFRISRMAGQNQFYKVGSRQLTFVLVNDGTPVSINFNKGVLKGSPINEKLHRYDLQAGALEMAMQYAYMAQNRHRLDSLRAVWQCIIKEAVSENTDNIIPAYYINEAAYFCPYDEMKQFLSPDKPYYDHPLTEQARAMLHDYELKLPGNPFNDMELTDSFGRQRKLSEWCGQGKHVLLHFWNSVYEPCRKDMPRIVYCYEEFHAKGLEIVGISLDANKQDWLRAINEFHMVWPQLSDLKGQESAAITTWGIHTLPVNVLIAPDGTILATNLFNGALEDKLEEIFGE